ncbi:MAG: c-type cytochrome [Geminicoccaceae bacterium]
MLQEMGQPRERKIALAASLILAIIFSNSFALNPARAAFEAHGGPVKSVAVSADGSRALTASFDYSIILWDLEAQSVLIELEGHDAAVNAVVFLPGDRRALSASDDGTIALWDLEDGETLSRFRGHSGKVVAIAVSPDGRLAASAGWDRTIRLWDLENFAPMRVLSWRDNINAVRFSVDGEAVIAGTSDGALTIWRANDGIRLAAISSHDFAVTDLDQTADDGVVATSSIDETVRLWDLGTEGDEASRQPITTLFGHVGPVLSVDLSEDGELVASGGVDGTVRVWRRGDGDRLKVFARHQGPVWSVVFTPDGEMLLSGGADGLVLTYDLADPANLAAAAARGDEGVEEANAAAVNGQIDNSTGAGGAPSRGEKLFRTCSACHTTTPDDGHRAGPTLYGLFGRIAGSHPDYSYSEALLKSDLVWSEETIDELFAIGPDHLLPGTKMPLQRMPDSQDRADLIAFLKRVTTP